jgi:hypothetical protein
MNDARVKIQMMENSLRCLMFGLLGLLPFIGLPFAFVALILSANVRAGQRQFWNPARPYWICGMICAAIGLVFWSMMLTLILYHTVFFG